MAEGTIKLNINGEQIIFNVDDATHEKLVDEMTPGSKVAPMHNFLSRTVAPESKQALAPLIKNPASVMVIGTKVLEEFVPKLTITLGE